MNFEQALSSVPFFGGLDLHAARALAGLAGPIEVAKGDFLFREGDVANHLFWLERGRVEISRRDLHFGKQIFAVLTPPTHFGGLALFYSDPHFSTAVALESSTLVVLKHDDVQRLLMESPALTRAVAQGMAASLRAANVEIRRLTSQLHRSMRPLLKLPPHRPVALAGTSSN